MSLGGSMKKSVCLFCSLAVFGLVTRALFAQEKPAVEFKYPKFVTRYDLATRDELRYSRWLRPLIADSESSKWTWPQEFVVAAGTWATSVVDSRRILEATLDGCPIDGQPALASVDEVVVECAQILGVPKPTIIVRNDPHTRAYIVAVGEQPHLVLTSSLLNLYERQPDQLRFIVGRELGRIKTDQLQLRRVTYGLLVILQSIDERDIPDTAKAVLMSYGVGRFLTWGREAEITADRAGLMCCGSPETAYAALLKMLHGMKEDSAWRDPLHPDFDADKIIEQFQRWEKQPIVATVRYFRKQSLQVPFLIERLAALKQFVASGQYQAILDRQSENEAKVVTTLLGIDLVGLADSPQGAYAYVKCYIGDKLIFTSPTAAYGAVAYFNEFRSTLTETAGEPIFVEIWNDGRAYDELLGGFVIYPEVRTGPVTKGQDEFRQKYAVPILWDWKDRSKTTRNGVAHVSLRVVPLPTSSQR